MKKSKQDPPNKKQLYIYIYNNDNKMISKNKTTQQEL